MSTYLALILIPAVLAAVIGILLGVGAKATIYHEQDKTWHRSGRE